MKERPILFSGPMVRAILDGRKTQTRRVAKLPEAPVTIDWGNPTIIKSGEEAPGPEQFGAWGDYWNVRCPYGAPGDRLWVRETWLQWACPRHDEGQPPNARCDCEDPDSLRFRADSEIAAVRWKPSIFMPRWASRISLEVTGVRVERLAEISEADAAAEGVTTRDHASHYGAFGAVWDSINGDGSFATSPWVWVVEFKRLEARVAA